MRKTKKFGMMMAAIVLSSFMLTGCLDDEDSDYAEYEAEEQQEDGDAADDSSEETGGSISEGAGEINLYNYPMGTVKEVEGNIAVVTIVADDATTSWDFESGDGADVLAKYHDRLGGAMQWLESNIGEYGRDVHFIWDWEENEELLYDATFNTDLGSTINSQKEGIYEADEIISNRINSEALMSSLNANGIVYFFAVNSDPDATNVSCSFDVGSGPESSQKDYWYMMDGMDEPPYEFLVLMLNQKDGFINSQTIAHEFIHSLSVPDLYAASDRIPQEFVDYAWDANLLDIMQDDQAKGARITEVTAYYMGLIGRSDMVDEWGLGKSTHNPESRAAVAKDVDPIYEQFVSDELELDGQKYSEIFSFVTEDFGQEPVYFYYDVDEDGKDELLVSTLFYGYNIYDIRDGKLLLLDCGDGTAAACGVYKGNGHVYVSHSDFSHAGRQLLTLNRYDGDGNIVETIELNAEYWDNEDDMYDENSDFTYNGKKITMQEYEDHMNSYEFIDPDNAG